MKPQSSLERKNLMSLAELQPANLDKCIETIAIIRQKHPKIIPSSISNEIAGRLLGILNNNQMELERYGGTGLFLKGCLCEHSCLPNSSYSTDYDPETGEHQFTLVAIREISPGDHISIDYANHFYHSLPIRQSYLQRVYNFSCSCSLCAIPSPPGYLVDPFRSFYCPLPHCLNGIVHAIYMNLNHLQGCCYVDQEPIHESDSNNSPSNETSNPSTPAYQQPYVTFKCSSCDWTPSTREEWISFINVEDNFCNNPPDTLIDYLHWKSTAAAVAPAAPATPLATAPPPPPAAPPALSDLNHRFGIIHPLHYLVFWLEDNLTTLSLEEIMNDRTLSPSPSPVDMASKEKIKNISRVQTLQHTLTTLLAMIHKLNSFPSREILHIFHEKIIYWDRIGQTAIALADYLSNTSSSPPTPGNLQHTQQQQQTRTHQDQNQNQQEMNIEKMSIPEVLEIARHAFKESFEISRITSGEESLATQELKRLAGLVEGIAMPTNLQELQYHYSHSVR